jgi:hypothetical protein
MLDDVSNDIGVHGKVIVNQNVSHAHYLRPGYALLTVAKLLRQRARRPAFDIRCPIKDIPESFLRVSYRGIASLRTRSRMRVLSPRSVTTSTS